MARPVLLLLAACVGSAGMCLSGCGAASEPRTQSISLAQIEAQNRSRLASNAARTRRIGHELAKRRSQRPEAEVTKSTSASAGSGPPKPPIVQAPIPFPAQRKQEMAAYAQRHYGIDTYELRHPKVIVEHYTVSADARSAINLFSSDSPDSELHELPGTCAHFVIDRDGTIYQLVPLTIMCRHTVGLNYTSIGIEQAGFSDQQILSNPAELKASLALTRWLRCRSGISIQNVIGHNESLSSPYHRERVASLRSQTHGDWTKADMAGYRARLQALPGCQPIVQILRDRLGCTSTPSAGAAAAGD